MAEPYLYQHQNPNAPRRRNGKRFFGYPERPAAPTFIGLHTTESVFDPQGADGGAEQVAAYQARTERPSSYHRIVDRDSTVMCLPDEAVAFGIGRMNSRALHVSFALNAVDWGDSRKAVAAAPMLERGAEVVAAWCRAYDIPARRITRAQALSGTKGLLAHGDADPERRSDPGAAFAWQRFLTLVGGEEPAPSPTKGPDMLLVLEPETNKQWLCGLDQRRWVRTMEERAALLAAGVPFLGGDLPAQQRNAVLSARTEVPAR